MWCPRGAALLCSLHLPAGVVEAAEEQDPISERLYDHAVAGPRRGPSLDRKAVPFPGRQVKPPQVLEDEAECGGRAPKLVREGEGDGRKEGGVRRVSTLYGTTHGSPPGVLQHPQRCRWVDERVDVPCSMSMIVRRRDEHADRSYCRRCPKS